MSNSNPTIGYIEIKKDGSLHTKRAKNIANVSKEDMLKFNKILEFIKFAFENKELIAKFNNYHTKLLKKQKFKIINGGKIENKQHDSD
jgi:hypothetical protein